MTSITSVFSKIQKKRLLLAGDFMLDSYTFGKTKRISPEAPVPVLHVESFESRPGGAGNVALNLVSLGQQVALLGRIGQDDAACDLVRCLQKEGIDTSGLFVQEGFKTPKKERLIAQNQQLLRIDYENECSLTSEIEQQVIAHIKNVIHTFDLVAISDYAKGFLSHTVLRALIDLARKQGIPVIVDPKGADFSKYAHATLLKPNLSEAKACANLPGATLHEIANEILKKTDVETLMITRSEAGISLFSQDGTSSDFPVPSAKEIRDVTGAGDTVLAVVAALLANNLSLHDATPLANIAAQIAVERVGCAQVTLQEIAERLIDLRAERKVFHANQEAILEHALLGKEFVQLKVKGPFDVDYNLLKLLRDIASQHSQKLLVTIDAHDHAEEQAQMLALIQTVDYVQIQENNKNTESRDIKPQAFFEYSGKSYS